MKSQETNLEPKTPAELLQELAALDPKPFDIMSPDNSNEVAKQFISREVNDFSGLTYSQLDAIDFDERAQRYEEIESDILHNPSINPGNHRHYQSYINNCRQIDDLMQTAKSYRLSNDPGRKATLREHYVRLNETLYNNPDQAVARGMFEEILEDTASIDDPTIVQLRQEFHDRLNPLLNVLKADHVKVEPTAELVEYINGVVGVLFEPVLKVVDKLIDDKSLNNICDQDGKVGADGTAKIFEAILMDVFPDSGWQVDRRDVTSVNVIAAEKTIAVPMKYLPKRTDQIRGVAVHETIHMLRAMMGEQTDLIPLQLAMPGYLDAEEGIAGIAEKAVRDIPKARTGYQHYLTATLIKSGLDLREIHEIMWRYTAIDHYQEKPERIDDRWLEKQQLGAAKYMIRAIRGTGDLSWQTMLSYYEGSHTMWQYLEKYQGDFEMMMLLFTGKIDPSNLEHQRAVWSAGGKT